MFQLKRYQEKALNSLIGFLSTARYSNITAAWDAAMTEQNRAGQAYDKSAFGDIPCLCLRLPTGGGKTLLGTHAVAAVAKHWQDSAAPVAIWLVPSDTIRSQTIEALNNPRHAYRKALESIYPDRVRVCDLESLSTIGTQEVGKKAIVIVATIQSFRVEDTTTRNVYSFDENFAPHFQGVDTARYPELELVTAADLLNTEGGKKSTVLTEANIGQVKASLANWLHLHQPVVIVDEAHNSRTHNSFTTLKRLNPSCIVELTATPIVSSNVLYHVSALELKAEDMIKLPIVLSEHPTGWSDAVRDAVLMQRKLEILAQKEHEYIRPIVLFQAEPKGGTVQPDDLKKYLVEQENIDPDWIKIATGKQKELDGVDLFDRTCPVRYVITIEALKEGWDCSFAYVLCSLQEVRSAKDIEQLLGRVLRMPYARKRDQQEMNQAYAHVIAESFSQGASTLVDSMVKNMGFEPMEMASVFTPVGLDLFGQNSGQAASRPKMPEAMINLSLVPTQPIPTSLSQCITIHQTTQGATAIIHGEITEEVEEFLLSSTPVKQQAKVVAQITQQRQLQQAALAPAMRGEVFAVIPQLCLWENGECYPVDSMALADAGGVDLLAELVSLNGFTISESANTFEIDIDGKKLSYSIQDTRQLNLDSVPTTETQENLVRWLDREMRQQADMRDITLQDMQRYLGLLIDHLMRDRKFTLTSLFRTRFHLCKAVIKEVNRLRCIAVTKGYQLLLPEMKAADLSLHAELGFRFKPNVYPARPPFYSGRFNFKKHYYAQINDLLEKRKDGKEAEEFTCAKVIEAHPLVKHWVRNIQGERITSFWLPTSTDYFYPDFVAELVDGRVIAIEYKGEHLRSTDDTKEKAEIGAQWEASSNGVCLFLMVYLDDRGRTIQQQIEHKLAVVSR